MGLAEDVCHGKSFQTDPPLFFLIYFFFSFIPVILSDLLMLLKMCRVLHLLHFPCEFHSDIHLVQFLLGYQIGEMLLKQILMNSRKSDLDHHPHISL